MGLFRIELKCSQRENCFTDSRANHYLVRPIISFERMTGIEPAGSCLASTCSTLEHHPHSVFISSPHPKLHRDFLLTKQAFCC